MKRH
jgi:hypothetical protein